MNIQVLNVGTGVGSGKPIAFVRVNGRPVAVKFPIFIDGWEIGPTDDPWALKYNLPYRATNDGKVIMYGTLEEAIEDITTR